MKNNKGTFKEFWDGPLTWAGGIILAGYIIQAVTPNYMTTNVHPDYTRDSSCMHKLTEAHTKAMESDDWYTKGHDYDYLRSTIYIPCQQKLRQYYIDNYPEYNRRVNLKDVE